MRYDLALCGILSIGLAALGCTSTEPDISPAHWPSSELDSLFERNGVYGQPYPRAEAPRAMVAANVEVVAIRAGLEALKQGGTAMDAAVATSLAQISVQAGAAITFAGQMTLLYYEAETGQVHGLDASFNTVLGETDPYSIPPVGSPSGRAVLVPGLMRGFEVAHQRFGALPWSTVVEPAIYFAETGVTVDARFARLLGTRREVLSRLPETKRVFTKENGEFYTEGDHFTQPELAHTLRQVASLGTDYLYDGAWGEEFVNAVQADGGSLVMEDMRSYEPVWAPPVETTFRGYRVFAPGPPSFGGASTAEALNLLELADLEQIGHYRETPDALYRLLEIAQVADFLGPPMGGASVPEETLAKYFPGADLSLGARTTKAHAAMVWEKMQGPEWGPFKEEATEGLIEGAELMRALLEKGWGRTQRTQPQHTSGVIAIDEQGNAVALMHSINSSFWGNGLMVGGISIPNAAAFQQHGIATAGPGAKLPEPDNPLIVLQDGRPVMVASGHGGGIHEVGVQGLLNVLEFGMDPMTAVGMPSVRRNMVPGRPLRLVAGESEFPESTLLAVQEMGGLNLEIVTRRQDASSAGYWVVLTIDPETGQKRSGITLGVNGGALGY